MAALADLHVKDTPADSYRDLFKEISEAADVLVLAVAGVVAGLFGHWFIGISLRWRGWPGVLTFMVSSFVTCFLVVLTRLLARA